MRVLFGYENITFFCQRINIYMYIYIFSNATVYNPRGCCFTHTRTHIYIYIFSILPLLVLKIIAYGANIYIRSNEYQRPETCIV